MLVCRDYGTKMRIGGKTLSTFVLAAAVSHAAGAYADESDARNILQAMSDYMGAQTAISFDYDAALDVVTEEQQTLSIASSGSGAMERPDRLHATRHGGFATVEAAFDGETLTIVNTHTNEYAEVAIPGTVENLVDEMRNTYHRPLPAADLLALDFAGGLLPQVTDVKDLGSGVIGGTECDHLAFRTEEFDVQIWVAQGAEPYPCRYSIANSQVTGMPEYRVDVRNWKTGDDAAVSMEFSLPDGATLVEISALSDVDDLAGIYATKGGN